MQVVNCAGGIVLSPNKKIVVVNQNGDSWSLPKGRVDGDETKLDAARREIYEESGLDNLKFIRRLGSYERFRIGKGGIGDDTSHKKTITMYLFSADELQLTPHDPYNPEAVWLSPEEAVDQLTHPKDKEFLQNMNSQLKGNIE